MPEEKKTEDTGGKVTAGTLRELIRQEIAAVADVLTPGKSTKDADEDKSTGDSVSIKAQVQAALAQLEKNKKREERDAEVDEMLKKYKEPPREKAPVERRRVEKWMRWHDPEDDK